MLLESQTMTDSTQIAPENVPGEVPKFDENAFRSDLTALIPHLRAFARSLCGNATLADDVAQDTLLKAWNAREKFIPGSNLKAWTFTILRNQFYSIKRRSWRSTSLEPEVAEQTIVANSDAEQSVHLNELRRGLDMLQDDQREAIILIGASGLSYEEAAEICGCAVGTIKSRVSRARKTLEGIMETGKFDTDADGVDAMSAMDAILDEAAEISNR